MDNMYIYINVTAMKQTVVKANLPGMILHTSQY